MPHKHRRKKGGVGAVADDGEERQCKYCWSSGDSHDFVSPCKCIGTVKWVHHACLEQWLPRSDGKCGACKAVLRRPDGTRYKPYDWRNLARDIWHVINFILLNWPVFVMAAIMIKMMLMDMTPSYNVPAGRILVNMSPIGAIAFCPCDSWRSLLSASGGAHIDNFRIFISGNTERGLTDARRELGTPFMCMLGLLYGGTNPLTNWAKITDFPVTDEASVHVVVKKPPDDEYTRAHIHSYYHYDYKVYRSGYHWHIDPSFPFSVSTLSFAVLERGGERLTVPIDDLIVRVRATVVGWSTGFSEGYTDSEVVGDGRIVWGPEA